ncbi:uncharacterized protein [Phyllobates terribilis]|uniref:uncharacterized protein isoform X3 n=1 Tax=Phyllobates terribilis TaxID=111132 RepID=UPI003CCAD2C6
MNMDRDKMAEQILHLTLEILFWFTGEDYIVVKKTSSERCQDFLSEGWERTLSPITELSPHPLMHEDINDQKILDLTYKMIELLTGEVPIRCQDVTVYFSMEEWEYLKGHKDLYNDIMMEVPQPLTSPDLSSKRTTPERCPRPLLQQDCKQEDPNIPQDHQGEDLTHINTTETYVRGDERCKEEIPTDSSPDDCTRRSEGQLTSSIFKSDELEIPQDTIEGNAITPDIPSSLHSKDVSSDPLKQVLSSDSLPTTKKNQSHKISIKKLTAPKAKKPFSCSEYGNSFPLKNFFLKHQRIHTAKNRFSCSKCMKCFNKKSDLVKHQRTHTASISWLHHHHPHLTTPQFDGRKSRITGSIHKFLQILIFINFDKPMDPQQLNIKLKTPKKRIWIRLAQSDTNTLKCLLDKTLFALPSSLCFFLDTAAIPWNRLPVWQLSNESPAAEGIIYISTSWNIFTIDYHQGNGSC